jgi:hypothetical protein
MPQSSMKMRNSPTRGRVGSRRIVMPMSGLARSFRGISRSVAFACCFGAPVLVAVPVAPLMAQQPAPRVVQGKVVDKSDAGLKGATVFLKDGHTLAVRSYVASDDGSYRFGQLSNSADYQLWAQVDGKKSPVKNITSFDTRSEFNITLKIDTK